MTPIGTGSWAAKRPRADSFNRLTALLAVCGLAMVIVPERTARASSDLFRPRTEADLSTLALAKTDRRRVQPALERVSDLGLYLGGGARLALDMANGARAERGRSLFQVRLLVVAGGKLHARGEAGCTAWVRDVARCEMTCDGGHFLLRRAPGRGSEGLDLVIGAEDGEDGVAQFDGIALEACTFEEGGGVNLVPVGGRSLVELPLIGD